MPITNPGTLYSRTVTGQWMHIDGSGPYSYDPIGGTFTLVTSGGGGGGGDASAALQTAGNAILTTIDTAIDAIGVKVPALGRAAAAASTPVVAVPCGARRSATITRAANTTAYTAGDVVGGALTFSAVADASGTYTIMGLDLMWDFGALPSGMAGYTLHLYSVTPPSAYADNAAWDLPSGDRASYIAGLTIGTPVDLGSTLFVSSTPTGPVVINLGTGETALYGYLVTTGAYTPAANSETGSIRLRGYANA